MIRLAFARGTTPYAGGFTRAVWILSWILVLAGLAVVAQEVVSPAQLESQSLQGIIDALPAGATLTLQPGTYLANVEIDKPMTLVGMPGTTLQPLDESSPVVTLTGASGVVLSGLTIEKASVGIRAEGSACSLSDCRISSSETGLEVVAMDSLTVGVLRCTFEGKGVGVLIVGACTAMMADCSMENRGTGLLIGGVATAIVNHCRVSGCYDGVVSSLGATAILIDSQVNDNLGNGIRLAPLPPDLASVGTGMLIALRTEIRGNLQWGITVENSPSSAAPCEDVAALVLGTGNRLDGNGYGSSCPADLIPASFSTSE